jgi:signal peptidase I
MRRKVALVASLFIAPVGPLMLGHYARAATSYGLDLLAFALIVAGVLGDVRGLVVAALLLILLVRVAVLVGVARRPPAAAVPTRRQVAALIVALMVADTIIAHGVRGHLLEAFKIPAGSMIPTLQVGDHLFVDKRARQPGRGDVVVFRYPKEPEKDFIKRVIAVGGDTVEWQDEIPVVNGRPVARRPLEGACSYQDYNEMNDQWEQRSCRAFEESLEGRSWRVIQDQPGSAPRRPVVVPAGAYYVLGDNRDNSHDSRYWGTVPPENVKGTALWVWWSSGPDGFRGDRFGLRLR